MGIVFFSNPRSTFLPRNARYVYTMNIEREIEEICGFGPDMYIPRAGVANANAKESANVEFSTISNLCT